jgi:hypothetical protein
MLNGPVLMKSTAQSLHCNTEATTVVWTEDAAHLLQMDAETSKIAVELTQVRERNGLLSESVLLIVWDYSTISECVNEQQQDLFDDHFVRIEQKIKESLTVKTRWGNRPVVNTLVKNAMKEHHELHLIIAGFERTATGIEEVSKKISGVGIVEVQL